jgi:hypothetical protein
VNDYDVSVREFSPARLIGDIRTYAMLIFPEKELQTPPARFVQPEGAANLLDVIGINVWA